MLEVRAVARSGSSTRRPTSGAGISDVNLPETTILSGPPATTTSSTAAFTFSLERGRRVRVLARRRTVRGLRGGPGAAARPAVDRPPRHRAVPRPAHPPRPRRRRGRPVRPDAGHLHVDDRARRRRRRSTPARQDPTSETTATIDVLLERSGRHLPVLARRAPPFTACTSPVEYSGLAIGWHNVAVRAVAAEGHVDISPATHGWTVQAPAETTAARHDHHPGAAGQGRRARPRLPVVGQRARHDLRVLARRRAARARARGRAPTPSSARDAHVPRRRHRRGRQRRGRAGVVHMGDRRAATLRRPRPTSPPRRSRSARATSPASPSPPPRRT